MGEIDDDSCSLFAFESYEVLLVFRKAIEKYTIITQTLRGADVF